MSIRHLSTSAGLLFWVAVLVPPLLSAPEDNRRQDPSAGFAPPGLAGKQFTLEEVFSLRSQLPEEWLGDGDCRVLTGVFGNGRNLGFAAVTAQPGGAAPAGTRFRFRAFDAGGGFIGVPAEVALDGAQELVWPWEFGEPRILEMCLEAPGASNFRAAVMPVGSKSGGSRVQYAAEGFVDAFRVGEATAWGVAGSSGGN